MLGNFVILCFVKKGPEANASFVRGSVLGYSAHAGKLVRMRNDSQGNGTIKENNRMNN